MLFQTNKNRQRFSTECSAGYVGTNMNDDNLNPVQRNYKDTLFRRIFSDKEVLLSLYNAISRKGCKDADELEIVTLENAIYMNKCQPLFEYMQYVEKEMKLIRQDLLEIGREEGVREGRTEGRKLISLCREVE